MLRYSLTRRETKMADDLKPGDVVMLKSGGPTMTIRWIEEEYGTLTALCDWFEGTKDKSGKYLPHQLEKSGGHRV